MSKTNFNISIRSFLLGFIGQKSNTKRSKTTKIFVSILMKFFDLFAFFKPQFGLLFDIDGVLTRGRKLLPYTRDAFRKLVTTSGQFRIPTVFVTNAGNELRSSKAAKLSQILGIPVSAEQVIMSHSPLKMYTEFHKKHCLISGQGPIADIAKNLGFTKVTTIEQLCDAFPNLDMVDHKKRRGFVR